MSSRIITTTIPAEAYADCKERGIKWSYLIRRGYDAITKGSEYEELQEANKNMRKKLVTYASKLSRIEKSLENQGISTTELFPEISEKEQEKLKNVIRDSNKDGIASVPK